MKSLGRRQKENIQSNITTYHKGNTVPKTESGINVLRMSYEAGSEGGNVDFLVRLLFGGQRVGNLSHHERDINLAGRSEHSLSS
jgi:hypothetical protein